MIGTQLREGKNNLQAVGLLKSNDLIMDVDNQGRSRVRGDIVIECRYGDNEIDEIRFNAYATEGSKPFESLKQAMDFTDKANALDESMVAKVRIIGGIELNEYVNTKDNAINSFNRNKAVFIYQTDRDTADMVKVELGCIIDGIREEEEVVYLDLLNVGYKNNVIELKEGVRVPEMFKSHVKELYSEGDTAVITLDIRNTAVIKNEPQTVAFGQVLEEKEIISEYVLSGGYPPLGDDLRYSDEEIDRIRSLRKQQYEQVAAKLVPETGGMSGGFNNFQGEDSSNPFA